MPRMFNVAFYGGPIRQGDGARIVAGQIQQVLRVTGVHGAFLGAVCKHTRDIGLPFHVVGDGPVGADSQASSRQL